MLGRFYLQQGHLLLYISCDGCDFSQTRCLTNCCCIQTTVISFNYYVYLSFANSFCSSGKSSEESKQWTMFSVERRPDFDGLQCCRTPPALDFHLTFQSSRRVTFDTFYPSPPPPFLKPGTKEPHQYWSSRTSPKLWSLGRILNEYLKEEGQGKDSHICQMPGVVLVHFKFIYERNSAKTFAGGWGSSASGLRHLGVSPWSGRSCENVTLNDWICS